MTTINIYLTFNGNCEEAFNFYKSVFGGGFQYIGRYGEMPVQQDIPGATDRENEKIMHITLPISAETMLMGNDQIEAFGSPVVMGNNFTISITSDSKQIADEIFTKLSNGGKITVSLKETFWNSYYGNVTDKFGIQWKMSVDLS